MRVLIVSYAYPPISSPGAMRVGHFAKDLKSLNCEVSVLTSENGYSSMRSDSSPEYFFEGIDLYRVPDLLSKNAAGEMMRRSSNSLSLLNSAKVKLVKFLSRLIFPDRDVTWLPAALMHKDLKNKQYDIVIGSYPSITNLILSKYLAKRFDAKLVVDMRDLWSEDENFGAKGFIRQRLELAIEKSINNSASLILSISEFNRQVLIRKSNCTVETIYNGYDQELIKSFPKTGGRNSKFKLAYAGSFYGGERDPCKLLHAIKSLKQQRIVSKENFEFSIYGHQEEFLLKLVSEMELNDVVYFRGMKSQGELLQELHKADILITITRKQVISKGELTTKLFEYLALNVQIMCLTKLDFEIASILSSVEHADVLDVDDQNGIMANLLLHFSRWNEGFHKDIDFCSDRFSRLASSIRLKTCLEALLR